MVAQGTPKLLSSTKTVIKLAKSVRMNFFGSLESNLKTYNNQGNS